MSGKSLILAVKIIGDATGATKAVSDTETALDKLTPAAALAGGASAAALTAGFFDAVSVEAGLSKVEGQLGLTPAEAERVGIVSAELFANGWGTGADQINEALSSVIGNIDGMREATDEQLSGVSQKVLSVANTFDQDLGGITTAVGQLMRTGMAPDADAALDIITTGLQSNTRAGDDLLDTFTEYPALFQRLGIDGQTATGLIAQGLDAGARSTDLVADALKEFQIRATDGTEASAAGFQALGLDAAAMTAQIAAGGEGARAGLDQVLDGLRSMTDPVAQNAAAVALFGTQAEDLGGALYALDPSAATAALGEVAGAATTLGDTVSDNTQQKLTEFARLVQTSFQDVAAQALPVIQPVLEQLKEFAPILGPLAVAVGAVSGAILIINGAMKAYAAVQAIATAAQWASNAAWLASPITWIILAIIAVIALLVLAILWVIDNWEQIRIVAAAVWESVIAWIQTAIEWVKDRISAAILVGAQIWFKIRDTATGVFQAVINWIQQAISWVRDGISGAINGVLGFFTGFRDTVVGVFQTVIEWVKNAISWISDLASNAVPGWAKDLLGMSGRSFSMPVTPEAMPFTIPRYAARMAVTPDIAAFSGADSALSVSAFAAPSLLSIPTTAPTLSRTAPQQAVYEDHSEHHYHFPNYLGDKEEIVEELEKALEKRKRRNDGLVQV